jgi:membrane-associated phospholipid phosphatase
MLPKLAKIQLPDLPIRYKWPLGCIGIVLFFFFYGLAAQASHPQLLPMTIIDQSIPMIPWTIIIYLSDYFYILFLLHLFKNQALYSQACYATFFGVTIAFATFFTFPTVFPREQIPIQVPWDTFFKLLHGFDAPSNCFPSLHVSNTLIPTWFCVQQLPRKRDRWLLWLWAIAICLSTVTTKQHYAVDILGGLAVTWISIELVKRVRPHVEKISLSASSGPTTETHPPHQKVS